MTHAQQIPCKKIFKKTEKNELPLRMQQKKAGIGPLSYALS